MRLQRTLLVISLLALIACQTPATPAPTPTQIPTATPLPEPTATSLPKLSEGLVKIPGATGQTIAAEVSGSGDTVIIFANMSDNYSGVWLKLMNALNKNDFTLVNFTYTVPEPDTARAEMDAVLKYLDEHGVKRFVCVGASLGTMACTHAAQHPGMAGLVFMAGPRSDSLAKAKYPKLFIIADKDGNFPESTQAMYDEAADPKTLEVMPGYAHGAALFLDGSLDVAATIADFLNNLP